MIEGEEGFSFKKDEVIDAADAFIKSLVDYNNNLFCKNHDVKLTEMELDLALSTALFMFDKLTLGVIAPPEAKAEMMRHIRNRWVGDLTGDIVESPEEFEKARNKLKI